MISGVGWPGGGWLASLHVFVILVVVSPSSLSTSKPDWEDSCTEFPTVFTWLHSSFELNLSVGLISLHYTFIPPSIKTLTVTSSISKHFLHVLLCLGLWISRGLVSREKEVWTVTSYHPPLYALSVLLLPFNPLNNERQTCYLLCLISPENFTSNISSILRQRKLSDSVLPRLY